MCSAVLHINALQHHGGRLALVACCVISMRRCLFMMSSLMVPACYPGGKRTAHKVTSACLYVPWRVGGEECMYIYNSPPFSTPCSPHCDKLRGGMMGAFCSFHPFMGRSWQSRHVLSWHVLSLIPNAHIEKMKGEGGGGRRRLLKNKKDASICKLFFFLSFFSPK